MSTKKYLDNTGLSRVKDKITALLSNKQDTLVSGTNIKTVNNESLLGNGNINLEKTANKVTTLSSSSTDTQYPSAKCVYNIVGDIETILTTLTIGGGVS